VVSSACAGQGTTSSSATVGGRALPAPNADEEGVRAVQDHVVADRFDGEKAEVSVRNTVATPCQLLRDQVARVPIANHTVPDAAARARRSGGTGCGLRRRYGPGGERARPERWWRTKQFASAGTLRRESSVRGWWGGGWGVVNGGEGGEGKGACGGIFVFFLFSSCFFFAFFNAFEHLWGCAESTAMRGVREWRFSRVSLRTCRQIERTGDSSPDHEKKEC